MADFQSAGGNDVILEVGLGELAQVKQVEKIKMKFDRRNRRVNVKTVKKEMWNVIKEARQKSFIEKENIENEAEEPEANFGATTFTDMQEELQSKLEGENKGKHHIISYNHIQLFRSK